MVRIATKLWQVLWAAGYKYADAVCVVCKEAISSNWGWLLLKALKVRNIAYMWVCLCV